LFKLVGNVIKYKETTVLVLTEGLANRFFAASIVGLLNRSLFSERQFRGKVIEYQQLMDRIYDNAALLDTYGKQED
jgi:hypothetical protein